MGYLTIFVYARICGHGVEERIQRSSYFLVKWVGQANTRVTKHQQAL